MNTIMGMTETTMLLWSVVLGLVQIAVAAMGRQQRCRDAVQFKRA